MLTIDQTAAAHRPDPRRAAEWLAGQRVFVSSCMADTRPERRAVAEAVSAAEAMPVWFEVFGRDGDAEEAYLAEVDSSTIYMAVLNEAHGRQDRDTGLSATEAEYQRARQTGKRIQIWIAADAPQRDPPLVRFIGDRLRVFHTTEDYNNANDLSTRVQRRLQTLAAEALSPWVKVGSLVFRATEIEDDGTTATVRAQTGTDVVRALEALRGGNTGYSHTQTRFAYEHSVWNCRVAGVATRIVASGSSQVTVEFEQLQRPSSDSMRTSFGGITADDLVEHGLRELLFGVPLPQGLQHGFGFAAGTGLDADSLQQCFWLANDIAPAVTRLVLSDGLVGAGKVSAVTDFLLGPRSGNVRRLLLQWQAPQHYADEAPATHTVEGDWFVSGRPGSS